VGGLRPLTTILQLYPGGQCFISKGIHLVPGDNNRPPVSY